MITQHSERSKPIGQILVEKLKVSEQDVARAIVLQQERKQRIGEVLIEMGLATREDLEAASVVGTFWLVANALERDLTLEREVTGRRGVRIASESYGAGVYEAVVTTLAERRAR